MMEGTEDQMRTADFRAELEPNGRIAVPPEVAAQVPAGAPIQVLLQWGISDDEVWGASGRERFEAAYDADDSVYESLGNNSMP